MSVEDSWFSTDKATGKKVQTKRHGYGKRWRVRNRGARTVNFAKRSDADAYDISVKADLLKGVTPFDRSAGRVKFKEYARKWLVERYHNPNSRSTVSSRLETHLIPFFGEKRMSDIKVSTVTGWRVAMRDKPKQHGKAGAKLAPATISAADTLLVSILLSALADKLIAVNPCDGAVRPLPVVKAKVQVWEQETVHALLDAVPARQQAIPLVAATCGHRQGEALAVGKADVNFLRKEITIRHQVQLVDGTLVLVPPKRGKVRTVPLPEVTNAALAAHIARYGTTTVRCTCCGVDNQILFAAQRGRLISARVWDRTVWHPAVTAAGMVRSRATGLHQLRHFYASTLIEGGASMEQVRDYLGHASITITAGVYGHLFERSHEKARTIVDQAFSARVYSLRTQPGQ